MDPLLAQWRELEEKVRQGGGPAKIAKQHKEGKLTARERVTLLLDPGAPVLELGLLVAHDLYDGQAPREAVKNLAARLPHATTRWYPGGHAFQIECPDFWKDVAAFFAGD